MDAMAEIQKRLAQHEANLTAEWPWEETARELAEKTAHLLGVWKGLEKQAQDTNVARRAALSELKRHEAGLVSLDLADVEAWSVERRRLVDLADALSERYRLLQPHIEFAKRQHDESAQSVAPAQVKSEYIHSLKSIVSNPRSGRSEVLRAAKELEKIFDEGRPRVVDLSPEIDKRLYNEKGMLLDG